MKTLINIGIILSLAILSSCATSHNGTAYQYDDIYYSPKDNPTKVTPGTNTGSYESSEYADQNFERSTEKDNDQYSNASYDKNSHYDYYDKGNSEELSTEPQNNSSAYGSNSYSSAANDYYDYEYAARLRRFHSPYVGAGYYDDFYTNRYYYDNTPAYYASSIYGGNSIYDPYPYSGIALGYSSLIGWSAAVSFGFGWGYTSYYPSYYYGSPFYYSYYYPYRYHSYYSPFGYSYYYGYHHGYHHGYHDGLHDGYYDNGHYRSTANRNFYGPRGTSGSSSTYRTGSSVRPSRSSSNVEVEKVANPSLRPSREVMQSGNTEIPSENTVRPEQENARPERPSTPEARPENTRPAGSQPHRPDNTNERKPRSVQENPGSPVRQNTSSPVNRPTYVRPDRNNSYNRQPVNQPRVQPRSTRPSSSPRQQSRPSYNRNNSYSMPSRSSGGSYGGGGSSTPSSRPSRSGR